VQAGTEQEPDPARMAWMAWMARRRAAAARQRVCREQCLALT